MDISGGQFWKEILPTVKTMYVLQTATANCSNLHYLVICRLPLWRKNTKLYFTTYPQVTLAGLLLSKIKLNVFKAYFPLLMFPFGYGWESSSSIFSTAEWYYSTVQHVNVMVQPNSSGNTTFNDGQSKRWEEETLGKSEEVKKGSQNGELSSDPVLVITTGFTGSYSTISTRPKAPFTQLPFSVLSRKHSR